MRDHVAVWFGGLAYQLFAPPIEGYTDILLSKVIPLFDDVDGEQQRITDAVMQSKHWGPDDHERASEAAIEVSRDHILQFMEMRSVFLAAGVSGLFHLFEKQLYRHLNRELRDWLTAPINEWSDAAKVIERLVNRYDKPTNANELLQNFSNEDLKELRHVAHAVKHGEGRSTEALKKMDAPVVNPSRINNDWTIGEFSILNVAVSVSPSDVMRYRDAVLAFWRTTGTYWAPRSAFG